MKRYTCSFTVNLSASDPRQAQERLNLLRDFITKQEWVNWMIHPDDEEEDVE